MKGIIVSGYFNPLHKGHIELFNNAKKYGDKLIVIVNNDSQRSLKGSKKCMLADERLLIIKQLRLVDHAILSIDTDKTVSMTIKNIHKKYSSKLNLFFANGGDQDNSSIPESKICSKLGIGLIDNLGGKVQSSSWLLNQTNEN